MNVILRKGIILIAMYVVSALPTQYLSSKENFIDAPNIIVSKDSLEGLDIAHRIAQLFRKENRPIQTNLPSKDDFQTNQILSSTRGASINFNFNVALDVSDGKISRIRLPHGDLLLLFVAADQNKRVNINAVDFQEFLSKTVGTTHMAKVVGNGKGKSSGIAFMSWAKLHNDDSDELGAKREHVSYRHTVINSWLPRTREGV